jgi:uncharacterized protein
MKQVSESFKPFAIVTGASSGIGYELAKQFAQHGFDLAIVAEDSDIIEAAEVCKGYGSDCESFQIDLASYEGVEEFYSKLKSLNRPIDAAILNAGVGVGGSSFVKSSLDDELNLIRLNVTSTVHLTKRILTDLVKQGYGRLLFTSSVAASMPGPYESVYSASKAFIQSFAEAIRAEVKDYGISVTALQPGPTETNFFHRAGMDDTKIGQSKKDDPAEVARQGYEALMSGKDHVVAGSFMNAFQTTAAKVLPETIAAKMHQRMTEPNSSTNR